MKQLPIGISDYKKIIEEDYYYIDKTLFIKEILERGGAVTLLPRPRRFGKTLNVSMLRYFFENTQEDKTHLFAKTAIWQDKNAHKHFGQYPVIYLTFKEVKEDNWENAYEKIKEIIAQEFIRHSYLLQENLPTFYSSRFNAILDGTASNAVFSRSLLMLTDLLSKYHKKNVIVLIDEYDAPIHSAYLNRYYTQMVNFVRSLFTAVLKDNSYLEWSVVTGILRTAKEGIFSGLNNLLVCTVLDIDFHDKFGFTESEVKLLLKDQKLSDKAEDVKIWYDGYTFSNTKMYNPWSIIQCAYERGLLKSYWINTSDNALIKNVLTLADEDVKSEMELLLSGQTIEKEVEEAVIIPGIERNSTSVWSLLLFSGYLTYTKLILKDAIFTATLTIPNKEIKILYTNLIREIFKQSLDITKTKRLLQALTTGDIQTLQDLLQEFIINSISAFDLPKNEPEKSYHLFILGLLVHLNDHYEVKSNRESGYGRYDIMIIPRKPGKLGLIVEFKKVLSSRKETLETAAKKALQQIKEKNYIQELYDRGIKSVQLVGIAFQGKKLLIKSEKA